MKIYIKVLIVQLVVSSENVVPQFFLFFNHRTVGFVWLWNSMEFSLNEKSIEWIKAGWPGKVSQKILNYESLMIERMGVF